MKRQTHKKISLLGLGLYVLILLHSATVLSQPTQSSSEQKERIDKLKSIVRQDPLATQAIDELHKLQKQRQAEKIEALEACLEGLTSFMQGANSPPGNVLTCWLTRELSGNSTCGLNPRGPDLVVI